MTRLPSVGVVVPTRDRPHELRAALAAIDAQDYAGDIEVVVVFDQADPDLSLADGHRVRVLANDRAPGLAGARNSGILALDTDLVAFCDDDDTWLPAKLTSQVKALTAAQGAEFASCGIAVRSGGRTSYRTVGRAQVSYQDLLRSRMVMVHSSTYLASRAALLGGIGLVDESIPASQNEDWDLALRAARRRPILNVDEPLVLVRWGDGSFYAQQWESKIAGLRWMLDHHPDIAATGPGAARVYAQIAFGYACLGRRGEASRWAARALRRNWHERRVPFVIAVASGAVSGERLLHALHSRGHGI
ncbi:MAG TPA: glycosyltransferase [Streptosporangiaceae bacterium]|jgi:glycosyltransferase involved in cell wall biosynthesis|nr:glycosyltransferase [Streptosporangiaceae bacterium]